MDGMKLVRYLRTIYYLEDRNFVAHPEAKMAQDETVPSRLAPPRVKITGL
jgi:hypothetical protein